jgi:hypothetical protein
VIVFNFSVLARPAENLSLRQPDSDGRALWGAMFDKYMGRMIVVCDEVYDRTQFMDWLKREQFKASMLDFLDEVDPVLKAEKVHRVGSAAGKINWYVDNDARACAETIKLGIPTIVAVSPYIVRPEWDTGRKIKEWGSLVDEIDTQALKAAERSWRDV